MSWFKKAKLIDQAVKPETSLTTVCMWCNKWATSPSGNPSAGEERIWKHLDEMLPDERQRANEILEVIKSVKNPVNDENIGLSHGICDECMGRMMPQ